MHELHDYLEQGGVLVTVNQRLARSVAKSFADSRLNLGKQSWATPRIYSLGVWLETLWNELRFCQVNASGAGLYLLQAQHEQFLWEEIVSTNKASNPLIDVSGVAKLCQQAWALIHEWNLRPQFDAGAWRDNAETQQFHSWGKAFIARCKNEGWVSRSELPSILVTVPDEVLRNELGSDYQVKFLGFDDVSIALKQWCDCLTHFGVKHEFLNPSVPEGKKTLYAFESQELELEAAAQWAFDRYRKAQFNEGNSEQLAIVVPQLEQCRDQVERIFQLTFSGPKQLLDDLSRDKPFHISIGRSLADDAVISDAQQLLYLLSRSQASQMWIHWLQHQVILGTSASRFSLQKFLAEKQYVWQGQMSLSTLLKKLEPLNSGSEVTSLFDVLKRCESLRQQWRSSNTWRHWLTQFAEVLTAIVEDKKHEATLSKLALWQQAMDGIGSGPMSHVRLSATEALQRVGQVLRQTRSAEASSRANIHIMGLLESGGETYDALWVTGMTDQVWPPSPTRNPFIPFVWQREYRLPHCNSERTLVFAKNVLERLYQAAPEVIVSYPQYDNDLVLQPSPLINGFKPSESPCLEKLPSMRLRECFDSTALMPYEDDSASPYEELAIKGGAYLVKDQSQCPMKAFARYRLNLQAIEEAEDGISAKDRGILIHKALQQIWNNLQSQAQLQRLSEDQRSTLIDEVLQALLQRDESSTLSAFERNEMERHRRLLLDWLEKESERPEFTIGSLEQQKNLVIAGRELQVRLDRIDEVQDGRSLLIDYKTGHTAVADWLGDRPDDPQLPLYASFSDAPIAGIAYAQLRPPKTRFQGLVEDNDVLPRAATPQKTRHADRFDDMASLLATWRHRIDLIVQEYLQGWAATSPAKPTKHCVHCPYTGLCRVSQFPLVLNDQQDVESDSEEAA